MERRKLGFRKLSLTCHLVKKMKPIEPDRVKFFIGILLSDKKLLKKATCFIEEKFGEIDYTSPDFNFNVSDYYKDEMGSPILRKFVSFANLINPGELAKIKIKTNEIENLLSVNNKRKINLDPGYMDLNKVVLASAKYNGQKIYLDHGIYADPTLWYEKGSFHTYPYSFPDFKTGEYLEAFVKIRALYKTGRK